MTNRCRFRRRVTLASVCFSCGSATLQVPSTVPCNETEVGGSYYSSRVQTSRHHLPGTIAHVKDISSASTNADSMTPTKFAVGILFLFVCSLCEAPRSNRLFVSQMCIIGNRVKYKAHNNTHQYYFPACRVVCLFSVLHFSSTAGELEELVATSLPRRNRLHPVIPAIQDEWYVQASLQLIKSRAAAQGVVRRLVQYRSLEGVS